MIKAIIFDLDDTLYNYQEINKQAIRELCQYTCRILKIDDKMFYEAFDYGRNITKIGLDDCAAQHNRMLYCQRMLEYLNVRSVLYALDMYEVYWDSMLKNMKLNEGVIELFEKLVEENIKIGICTDLTAHIQHRKIRKLEIDKYIDCIVSSEEAGREKPDSRIFKLCLEKLEVKSHEVIYIGDNFTKDILGARGVGIKGILFEKNMGGNLLEMGVQKIKCISELLNIIDERNEEIGR